jgi:hypothetical protein
LSSASPEGLAALSFLRWFVIATHNLMAGAHFSDEKSEKKVKKGVDPAGDGGK